MGPVLLQQVPTDFEFHRAMELAQSEELHAGVDGPPTCSRVRQLECGPAPDPDRAECSYRYDRDRLGTAVLERHARVFWRWVSGPRACGAARPYR